MAESKFEKLIIWQNAMDFSETINAMSLKVIKHGLSNLSVQTRIAIDLTALNISEGAIGQSNEEYKKFIGYAARSLAETATCLYKAKRREYITAAKLR